MNRRATIAKAAKLPVGDPERRRLLANLKKKRASAAVARALVMACASSSTCRKGVAKALRFPGFLADEWYDVVEEMRDELIEGTLTDRQERMVKKLTGLSMKLGRIQLAPLDLLADTLESMSNEEAEVLKKLAG
jgi:hypothetical protein